MDIERIFRLAFFDTMTGCYNRNWLEENRKVMDEKELTIVIIDLNNLKLTNDTLGHFAGDDRIIKLSTFLKQYGKVVRLGGDEFILFLKKSKIQKFKKECDTQEFSFGIVNKSAKQTLREAMSKADEKMYEMKKNR